MGNQRSNPDALLQRHDDLLVLSFVDGTQLLEIQGGELSEVIVPDFNLDEPTLFCGNVEGGMFVQVSARGVVLVDAATRTLVRDWRPPQGERITIAQANAKQIVCALAKRSLVYLEVKGRELIPGR